MFSLIERPTPPASGASATDLESLRDEIAALKNKIQEIKNPPATLSSQPAPAPAADPTDSLISAGGDAMEKLLARIDERVSAAVERRLEELKESAKVKVKKPKKRRVRLAEAARELELSAQQEDDLQRIYETFHTSLFKIAAGKDGDPEEVRREVAAVRGDPMRARSVAETYLTRVLQDIGGMTTAQSKRLEAIREVLGAEKARRLSSEFDIMEGSLLGIFGGASPAVEARDR